MSARNSNGYYLIVAGVVGPPVICDVDCQPTPTAYVCPRCGKVLCMAHDAMHTCNGRGGGPLPVKPHELHICPHCWRREGDPEARQDHTWVGLCRFCAGDAGAQDLQWERPATLARSGPPAEFVKPTTAPIDAGAVEPIGPYHFGITSDEGDPT